MKLTIPSGMYDDARTGFDVIDGTDGEAISRWSTADEAEAEARRLLATARYQQYGLFIRNRRDFTLRQIQKPWVPCYCGGGGYLEHNARFTMCPRYRTEKED